MREHFVDMFADRTRDILAHVRSYFLLESTVLLPQHISIWFSFPFLSPFLTFPKSGKRECLFLFYMLYLFIYIIVPHSCMPCLILHWFFDRGEIVRTAPWLRPVWSSLFAKPAPDSQRRLQALFFLVSEQISGKWKQMKKLHPNFAGWREGEGEFLHLLKLLCF